MQGPLFSFRMLPATQRVSESKVRPQSTAQFFRTIFPNNNSHLNSEKKNWKQNQKICLCLCMCARARASVYGSVCVCVSVRACVRACVCAWVCASCICASACLCVCVFACLCANLFCFCSFWRSGCWTPMYCCSMRCRTRASAWIWINTQYCPAPSKKW